MKKYTKQMLLGLLISLLGTIFYFSPPGQYFEEEYGLYWLYQLRGPIAAPDDVIIIDIGTESAKKLGLMETQQDFWPWPNDIHAQLIERLHQAGAKVIVLHFTEPFREFNLEPEYNRLLAKAMRDAGNVIIRELLQSKRHDLTGTPDNTVPLKLIQKASLPLSPELAAAALAHTPFLLPDDKQTVNAYWTFKPGMGDVPTTPAVVLQAYTLEVYNDLITSLHPVYPNDNTHPVQNLDPADDLESTMLFLRQLFINHPEIGEEISAQLQQNTTIDNRRKQLIQTLINLYSGQNAYYLNFYGPPHTIKTIPYYQFLLPAANNHKQPDAILDQVRGKVVFVGLTQSTSAEYEMIRRAYHTVFTEGDIKISGVEFAATAFANLLENKPVRPVPNAVSLALFVIIGFTLVFVFPILSDNTLIATSFVVAGIYTTLAWLLFKQMNIWLPLITPLFIIIPSTILGAVLLKNFTAKQDIDSSPRTDQLVLGTCMFTDIQGFATLSQQINLHQLRQLMDDYFRILSQSVKNNNGVVIEKNGSTMLAIWETTSTSTTPRRQACQAGLSIINDINHFNQQTGHPTLPTRIGIHSGELLVTRLGTMDNTILGVIGKLINTTNRIENANILLGIRLLVTDEVIDGIDDFLTRPLGHFLLKGCSQPVSLSELIDYRQQADNKQHVLCALFADALTAYQQQQPNAIEQWRKILKTYPDDGPTKFYLNYCLRLPPEAWQPTIVLSKKS